MRQESKPVSSASISSLYQKAIQAFLLKKYSLAWSTCNAALDLVLPDDPVPSPFRSRLWLLKINLAGSLSAEDSSKSYIEDAGDKLELSSKLPGEKLVGSLWTQVVEGFGGVEGDVDGEVVIACLLLSVTRQVPKLGQMIAESWFSSMSDDTRVLLSQASEADENEVATSADSPELQTFNVYARVVELYLLHVLAGLGDFESARSFLDGNLYLGISFKEIYAEKLRDVEAKSKEKAASSLSKLFPPSFLQNGHPASYQQPSEPAQAVGSEEPQARPAKEPSNRPQFAKAADSSRSSTPSSINFTDPKAERSPPSTDIHAGRQPQPQQLVAFVRRFLDNVSQAIRRAPSAHLFSVAFALMVIGLTTRRRGQLWTLFKLLLVKMWQTLRMGTQITYI